MRVQALFWCFAAMVVWCQQESASSEPETTQGSVSVTTGLSPVPTQSPSTEPETPQESTTVTTEPSPGPTQPPSSEPETPQVSISVTTDPSPGPTQPPTVDPVPPADQVSESPSSFSETLISDTPGGETPDAMTTTTAIEITESDTLSSTITTSDGLSIASLSDGPSPTASSEEPSSSAPGLSAMPSGSVAASSGVTVSPPRSDGPRPAIVNLEPTVPRAIPSTAGASASVSVASTPIVAATSRSYPLDQGDDNFVVAQDDISLPEQFIADEIISILTYTANYDRNLCETKAQQYTTRATQSLLSHWSFLVHRRQNSEPSSVCLPALYEIPTTVHWVVPSGADREKWVNWEAWDYQIAQTRNQLQQLNVALNLAPFRFYQGTDSDRMTNRPKAPENLDYAKAWVSSAKEASGSTAYNHLNIFIVENPNDDSLGYSNYPGATSDGAYPDAVIIGAASLPGNTQLSDGANVGDQDGREGTTLAHEIGHWLGLLHLHEGGCDGTDGISSTPQYASGSDYSTTCLGESMGEDGILEHNMMSFAAGRTVKSAFFNQEQMVLAAVGYFLRRNGLSSTTVNSAWLKMCPEQATNVTRRALPRHDKVSHLPLTRRQMSNELSRYCQQTDLSVPDYQFSPLAAAGLFGPNSPSIPQSPDIVRPETIQIANAERGGDDRAGTNFGDVNNRVEAQIAQYGSITSNDTTPIDSPQPAPRSGADTLTITRWWVVWVVVACVVIRQT